MVCSNSSQAGPSCATTDFEGYPCYLDVSMFEHLSEQQHRVHAADQATSYAPIVPSNYPANLPSAGGPSLHSGSIQATSPCNDVLNRENIPGIGGVNCHFFSHDGGRRARKKRKHQVGLEERGIGSSRSLIEIAPLRKRARTPYEESCLRTMLRLGVNLSKTRRPFPISSLRG